MMENVVTEDQDKRDEGIKIREAMKDCGYPRWSIDRVKQQMSEKQSKNTKPKKTKESEAPSNGMLVIPYVEGLSEKLQRVFKKCNISTAMRITYTLKSILVHIKDKKDLSDNSDVVYDIPRQACNISYIGETGRQFGVRLFKNTKKDAESIATREFVGRITY